MHYIIRVLQPKNKFAPKNGFALESRADVERIAAMAAADGCLIWPPRDEPYPVGYYCGLRDPAGNYVEFSYGQPLGPGSEQMPIP